jgi:hypothetical protein
MIDCPPQRWSPDVPRAVRSYLILKLQCLSWVKLDIHDVRAMSACAPTADVSLQRGSTTQGANNDRLHRRRTANLFAPDQRKVGHRPARSDEWTLQGFKCVPGKYDGPRRCRGPGSTDDARRRHNADEALACRHSDTPRPLQPLVRLCTFPSTHMTASAPWRGATLCRARSRPM